MYRVLQGKISNNGCGDYHVINCYDNLDDALDLFNEIKEDKKGWCLSKYNHLETLVIDEDYNEILARFLVY